MDRSVALVDGSELMDVCHSLDELIYCEKDLCFASNLNFVASCSSDGCNRISYCSCDCNHSTCVLTGLF